MQPTAELKITHGQENMTKSGKIFTIFQLLQKVNAFTNVEGDPVLFQPYEMFRVRRGQRGAMSVELDLGKERYMPLGISEDGKGLVAVDPINASTILMTWTRTSLEAQHDGLGDPASQGQDKIMQLELGEGPVKTQWVHGDLSATVIFQNPTDVERFGNFNAEAHYARNVIGVIAHNIEALREPNAFELEFYAIIGLGAEVVPQVIVVGEQETLFRLDFESKDMFAVAKQPVDPNAKFDEETNIRIIVSDVKRNVPKPVAPKLFDFEEVGAQFVPQSKLEEQELFDLLGADNLEAVIKAILMSETSVLARKWMNSYTIKAITSPQAYAGKLHVERVRTGEHAEGRGDIYHLDIHNNLVLDRHHMDTKGLEGPVFTLEDLTFKANGRDAGHSGRRGDSARGNDRSDARLPPRPPRNDGYPNRADMEVRLERHADPERPSRIPTREWIPQINQFVYIEDDAKKEMYFIADYDQYEHKFLLVLADSLRRERAARTTTGRPDLTNEKGQLPVEPGRLRPFVLFH
jgi:hypothetical protein